MMFGISGYVVEILENGFVLQQEKEMPQIFWRYPGVRKLARKFTTPKEVSTSTVETQIEGSKLGLKIGDYVKVMGGPDSKRGVFASSTAQKRSDSGEWETIPINHSDLWTLD